MTYGYPFRTLAAVTAGVLGLASVPASAQLGFGDADDVRDAKALYQAQISLADAVETVSAQSSDRVVAAEFDDVNGGYVWEVETLSEDGTERYTVVDAATGELLRTGRDD